jgi:hypothetical protein
MVRLARSTMCLKGEADGSAAFKKRNWMQWLINLPFFALATVLVCAGTCQELPFRQVLHLGAGSSGVPPVVRMTHLATVA